MSENNDELVVQFVEMSGSDPATALYFLEMSNYDLESALNLMFSGDVSPPSSFPSDFEDQEEDSIRVADPVKQQVLLDFSSQSQSQRAAAQSNLAFSRAEDPSVEWMFPPPNHLSFPGTLAEARSAATKDEKWILVNIQCDKEFSSHVLNRDVWTNETLVSLIRMNFIFWQRGKTSQDGQMFVSMHRLSPELGGGGFPMIGIVDSRTGALISEIRVTNEMNANDLILKLMEFLEANSLRDFKAPTVRQRTASKSSSQPPSTSHGDKTGDEDEDDEEDILNLASALKASMELLPPPPPKDSTITTTPDVETESRSLKGGEEDGDREITPITTASPSMYFNISLAETAEPEDVAASVKVSLKLAPELVQAIASASCSKPVNSLVRSFHGEEHTVQHVYAAVHFLLQEHSSSLPPQCQNRAFDLCTAFPRQSLHAKRELSVNGAGLKGSQVVMQWS